MSVWRAPASGRPHPIPHVLSAQELAIFAGAVLLAIMIGIAAAGLMPS